LRQSTQSRGVQVGLELGECIGGDGALEYSYSVAVIDFEVENTRGLQKSAGVAFEVGMIEVEEVGV
jgi:hypothetical protein